MSEWDSIYDILFSLFPHSNLNFRPETSAILKMQDILLIWKKFSQTGGQSGPQHCCFEGTNTVTEESILPDSISG